MVHHKEAVSETENVRHKMMAKIGAQVGKMT
jgi:hypothetical protein